MMKRKEELLLRQMNETSPGIVINPWKQIIMSKCVRHVHTAKHRALGFLVARFKYKINSPLLICLRLSLTVMCIRHYYCPNPCVRKTYLRM